MYSLHKGHVKMEAEVDVMLPQIRTPRIAGNHQNLKETKSFLQPAEEHNPADILIFKTSGLQSYEEKAFL